MFKLIKLGKLSKFFFLYFLPFFNKTVLTFFIKMSGLPEQFFDRFSVEKRIAFGAFSAVFEVKDTLNNGKTIALKIEKKDNKSDLLEYEFLLAKSVSGLPNVMETYDIFHDQKCTGISMELLFDVLSNIRNKRRNKPKVSFLLNITKNCLNSIKSLHSKGILHHDIKPSNFGVRLLDGENYEIVIFDFGLCDSENIPDNVIEFKAKLEQNPRYLPLTAHNESPDKEIWTEKSDIISLIYTLADFWEGTLPWDGRTTSKLIYEEKSKHTLESLLPPEMSFLVHDLDIGIDKMLIDCDAALSKCKRDLSYEYHYLIDPQDKGYKKPPIKLVFDPENKKKFKNQHSA